MKTRGHTYYIARPIEVPDTPETRLAADYPYRDALNYFKECARKTGLSYRLDHVVYGPGGEPERREPGKIIIRP